LKVETLVVVMVDLTVVWDLLTVVYWASLKEMKLAAMLATESVA
jgi:hypothetical protein